MVRLWGFGVYGTGLRVGMFPLITVLNRDSNRGLLESRLRTVSIRGNIPTCGVHGLGFGGLGVYGLGLSVRH